MLYANNRLRDGQCPNCALLGKDTAKDNLRTFEDGNKYCIVCNYFEAKKITSNNSELVVSNRKITVHPTNFVTGALKELPSRCITLDTCKFFNYQVGKTKYEYNSLNEEVCHIANYYDNNKNLVGQKLRFKPDPVTGKKRFKFKGNAQDCPLYGQWLWTPNEKLFITIVEGEIDAMSVAQTQGYQYPVVSVPFGAGNAKEALQRHLKFLLGFKYVVLAFDNDEPGQKATRECFELFEPGKVRISDWSCINAKDFNEVLQQRKEDEIKKIIFFAKEIIPEKSVTANDLIERVLVKPQQGTAFPWKTMTDITSGKQPGEILVFSAPPATGKTEVVVSIINNFWINHQEKCGIFGLEQNAQDTLRRMIGANLGLKLHLSDVKIDPEVLKQEITKFQDGIYFYDDVGEITEKEIFNYMRYWNKAKGVSFFVLDNLQALDISDDYKALKAFTNKLKRVMRELKSTIILVSHVNVDGIKQSTHIGFSSKVENPHENLTQDSIRDTMNKFKLDWENGRIPQSKNIEGGKYLVPRADYVFVFGRDRNSPDEGIRRIIDCKCIKARNDSTKDGTEFQLYYNDQGQLIEINKGNFE